MAQKSPIEWVAEFGEDGSVTEGYTVNPIRFRPHGSERLTTMCQKISPGCQHCYASSIVQRFWPKDADVKFPGYTAQGVAAGEFVVDSKQLQSVLKIKKAAKVFWGDMTDLFQDGIPDSFLDSCFAVCAATPHLIHMFLTKRPGRMLQYIQNDAIDRIHHDSGESFKKVIDFTDMRFGPHAILQNVMLGASAENQKYFDERIGYIDKLHRMRWKTFLSLEPLIGPIDVEYPKSVFPDGAPMCCNGNECGCKGMPTEPPMVYAADFVIVGGESGSRARPMQTNWASDIQQACQRWKVPFFFKQQGCWVDAGHEEFGQLPTGKFLYCDSTGRELSEEEIKASTEDSDVVTMKWVGKKRAGNTLYGKTYHEFPRS
jgi:protein gp37